MDFLFIDFCISDDITSFNLLGSFCLTVKFLKWGRPIDIRQGVPFGQASNELLGLAGSGGVSSTLATSCSGFGHVSGKGVL